MAMNRKEFILKAGFGTVAIACATCLGGCEVDSVPSAPENVDFTLDLSAPANTALTNVGGSKTQSGVLIGRVSDTGFVAVGQACTHQGTTVQFQLSNNRFHCPNHGSNFALDGGVINGPASSPLRQYNTSLDRSLLRVFS
jgi:cytochrome b6-f complex iron-sulfur subunit